MGFVELVRLICCGWWQLLIREHLSSWLSELLDEGGISRGDLLG